jgi:ribosome-associated toxin RatA of RatAB toxin-antitoxin module
MPDVKIDLEINAPIERVWETILDLERYEESMETVRSVRVVEEADDSHRQAAWSVLLKGSILEWVEEEDLDHEAHTVVFKQVRGDLDHFDGRWALEALSSGKTRVIFEVEFEIGIPMLADMLNPVAQRSLQENCTEMLQGIERAAAVG